jgi:putative dehydrogenase
MKPVVAIYAQGTMGAGLAQVLTAHGVTVLTSLAGRSDTSAARARQAGMQDVAFDALLEADLLLAVLPPGEALPFARRIAPQLRAMARPPVYVDCNAISPDSAQAIGLVIEEAGAAFLDVGIIGLPPDARRPQPRLYAAGSQSDSLQALCEYGLDVRPLPGGPGTASALKMAYAGITKGLIAVASSMILGATRAGVAGFLGAELQASEPQLYASLARRIEDMLPKAYRWVAEMGEISEFLRADPAAARIYAGAGELYDRLAQDVAQAGTESRALANFFVP